jgi:hypothetical protein
MTWGYRAPRTPCEELRSLIDALTSGAKEYEKELYDLLKRRDALDQEIAKLRDYLDTRSGMIPRYEHALEILTRKGIE